MTYEEKEFVSFDGTKLYIREYGEKDKPLLLLIHGGATDADFYVNTAPTLARNFHVIAYDRRGHVRSWLTANTQKPEDATKEDKNALSNILEVHAKDAAALIRYYGNAVDMSTGAYVIGHSLGGPVSMTLAVLYPQLIRKLLCVEPAWDFSRTFKQKNPMVFFPPVIFKDERGPKADPQVMENVGPDTVMLKKFDYKLQLQFRPDYDTLKDTNLCFAVGEQSKGHLIYEETVRLAKELDKPIFYHPGVHNTGFNLPKEFAYLCTGALLDPEI